MLAGLVLPHKSETAQRCHAKAWDASPRWAIEVHRFESRSDHRNRRRFEQHMPPLRGSVAWLTTNLGLASQATSSRRVATEDAFYNEA
jgi:hypothetical protein